MNDRTYEQALLPMKLLLFAIPIGLLPIAWAHESFTLLMASISALSVALAANLAGLRNYLVVLASVSISWTLAEASLSMMEGSRTASISIYDRAGGDRAHIWRVHDAYGMLPRPGRFNAVKHTDSGDLVYDVLYTIDQDGFRYTPQEQDYSARKAYFLGDSATFGEGLEDDQTLPFHWARLNPGYHVKNLAMSAWGLHQAYVVWRDLIIDEGAVVFVQTAPWHAERSSCIAPFSTFSPRFELTDGVVSLVGKCRVVLGNPFLDRLLNKSKIVGKIYDAVHRDDQSRKFELYIGIIDAMHRLADSRRQCLVVAFNKAEESYFDGSTYSNEFILQLLKQTGVEVVDVTLAERREELDPSYFIPDDGHPSDRGNQAKAGLLSAAKDRCAAKEALRPRSGGGAGTRRSDAGRRRQRRDRGSHGVLEAGPPRLGGTGE